MARLFIGHASANRAAAAALSKWLAELGHSDVFLDPDPDRGTAPDWHWQEKLRT
ncbi:MAG: hypothetical protein ACHQAQ_05840 [Hyphomicrobiales bacterium]